MFYQLFQRCKSLLGYAGMGQTTFKLFLVLMQAESDNASGKSPDSPELPLPHDFEVQKELHQKIRNDPDYDDWEYGTEPLPHEGWSNPNAAKQSPAITSQSPKP